MGAETIRDPDATRLPSDILASGYAIYSTVRLVRSVQPWARRHRDRMPQNFLMSRPVVAAGPRVVITLLDGYYTEQFAVNFADNPKRRWQVFDRTAGTGVPKPRWSVDPRRIPPRAARCRWLWPLQLELVKAGGAGHLGATGPGQAGARRLPPGPPCFRPPQS